MLTNMLSILATASHLGEVVRLREGFLLTSQLWPRAIDCVIKLKLSVVLLDVTKCIYIP